MNIVKWMRKNNRKLMAFVVIFIMVSFVGGYALQTLLMQLGNTGAEPIWTYRGGKITPRDIQTAEQDLLILQRLQMPLFLGVKRSALGPDLCALMLGHLLFGDAADAADLYEQLQMARMRGQVPLSSEQLDQAFTTETGLGPRAWILLTAEAAQAGCVVSRAEATQTLKVLVPQLYPGPEGQPGVTADQLVRLMIERDRIPEDRILDTFARLLAVLNYARMVTVGEDVTVAQIQAHVARKGQAMVEVAGERISAAFVTFEADRFLDQAEEPTEKELQDQLNTFKDVLPGRPTPENPHGLGYKLPARVQLEYLLVRHADVRAVVAPPGPEEMEAFYQNNKNAEEYRHIFQETLPADPNDPDAATTRIKSYPEVASQIETILHRRKANRTADMIINEARTQAEAPFVGLDPQTVTAEELAKRAADYGVIAQQVGAAHGVEMHTGKTGLLSSTDLAADATLSQLSLQGQTRMPVRLAKLVFAVEPLAETHLGRFEGSPPVPWANIGPLKDRFTENTQMTAIVRIVAVKPAEVPAGIDVEYSTRGVVLNDSPTGNDVFRLKDRLIEDVKRIKATPLTTQRAEEFVGMIQDGDWDAAIKAYNEKYAKAEGDNPAKPPLRIDSLRDRERRTPADIEAAAMLAESDARAAPWVAEMRRTNELLDRLVELLGPNRNRAENLKEVLSFPASWSTYVVKEVSRRPVTRQGYVLAKGLTALELDAQTANALAVVHFTPENIAKRMELKPAVEESFVEETAESDEASEKRDADDANAGAGA